MKKFYLFVLSLVFCNSILASSDSVYVVLNSGTVTHCKLVSASSDSVIVQNKGIDYTFTTKSAKAVLTDDGQYLLGYIESQSDYNERTREQRINRMKKRDDIVTDKTQNNPAKRLTQKGDHYHNVYLSLNPTSYVNKSGYLSLSEDLKSFSLGYLYDTPISYPNMEFFEFGVEFQFMYDSYSYEESSGTRMFMSCKFPLGITYILEFPSTKIKLAPSIGFDPACYIAAKEKETTKSYGGGLGLDGETKTRETDYFNDDEVKGYNRFSLGWHIGARLICGDWFFGLTYQRDLTDFYYNNKGKESGFFKMAKISIGACF